MKIGKHAKKKSFDFSFLNSFLKKITLPMIAQVVFLLMAVAMVGEAIYVAILNILPIKYLLVFILSILLMGALQVFLLLQKKAKRTFNIISMAISVIVIFVIVILTYVLGTFHNTVSALPEVDDDVTVEAPSVAVSKEPFIVYLSGMDTRGNSEIQDRGLSDVNMIMVVNPTTKTLLMVNIPRDYYVPLYGESNKMDKLTHAGTYGIDCSMKTLNALFDIQCNYYVKVNFKSVVDIVDALGGVTVTSDYKFSSKHSLSGQRYYFEKGENTLTGDQALAFARERYSFSQGDRQRGIHPQKVINAVINKAMSPAILNFKNLKNVLAGITENTKTNISYNDISDLLRMQLNDMSAWTIKSISVDGTGANKGSYAAGGQVVYVMIPTTSTVDAAKAEINTVLNATK